MGGGGFCPNLSFSPPALIALFCREIVAAATTVRYSCCRFGPADSTLISAKKKEREKVPGISELKGKKTLKLPSDSTVFLFLLFYFILFDPF